MTVRERLQSSMLFKKGNSLHRGAGESESDFLLEVGGGGGSKK